MGAPTLTPKAIRADIVARLKDKTAAGSRVFNARRLDVEADEVPCLTVLTTGAAEEIRGRTPVVTRRTEHVTVAGLVLSTGADADLSDALDDLEAQVRDAMIGVGEWAYAFGDLVNVETSKTLDVESRRRLGGFAMTFDLVHDVTYEKTWSDNFTKLAVTTDTTEPDKADVSTRIIPLEPAP